MNKKLRGLTLVGILSIVFLGSNLLAQAPVPDGINYQAIARNSSGSVYVNQNVAVKISILAGSATGAVQYAERHTATTNNFGLFTLKIGAGIPLTGTFSDITWNTANQFIKVEVDQSGGTNYTDLGASELLSVPYAQYAETSGNGGGSQGPQGPAGPQGPQGAAGVDGQDGAPGPAGPQGLQGLQGPEGVTGPQGAAGAVGPQGPTGPGSGLNCWDTDGDAVQDANEDVNNDGAWNALDCRGAQGVAGPQGVAGTNGQDGLQGAPGPAGPQGVSGPAGVIGAQGPAGLAGPAGPQGAAGPAGVAGPAGATGAAGLQGPQGPAGAGGTLDQSYDFGGSGLGRTINADAGSVTINASGTGAGSIGLVVNQTGTSTASIGALLSGTGNAINAASTNANNSFAAIQSVTNSLTLNNSAIFGQTTGQARGVTGEATAASTTDVAVRGNNLRTAGGIGVEGEGFNGVSGLTSRNDGFAIFGENIGVANVLTGLNNATAVVGVGGVGVNGQTLNPQLVGVLGQNFDLGITFNNIGILGQSETGVGVWGDNLDASYIAVFANGELGASGLKTFMIDHPADPANKFLKHFSIESNEVLNLYRGTIQLDENGETVVEMPSYFDLVNKDFSYQLTSIGVASPNLYVSREMENGKFAIAGGKPGQKVSWTVYADRNDPYVQQHPEKTAVEVDKREGEKGKYLQPDLYKQPQSLRMGINQPKRLKLTK